MFDNQEFLIKTGATLRAPASVKIHYVQVNIDNRIPTRRLGTPKLGRISWNSTYSFCALLVSLKSKLLSRNPIKMLLPHKHFTLHFHDTPTENMFTSP